MIKIKNTAVMGWEAAIRGMQNTRFPGVDYEKYETEFLKVKGEN